MTTSIIWAAIAMVSAVAFFFCLRDKNNNVKKNGFNDNFGVRD